MTITKAMTEKACAANRANAQKSTGPRDTAASSQNARKHGLLSKYLHFETDEERQEFEELLLQLEEEHQPVGVTETLLGRGTSCLPAEFGKGERVGAKGVWESAPSRRRDPQTVIQ